MTAETAIALSLTLVCIGVVLSSAEELASFATYRAGGLLDWRLSRLRDSRLTSGSLAAVCSQLYRPRVHQAILVTTGLCALGSATVILLGGNPAVLVALTLLGLLVNTFRSYYGMDGSRQMTLVVMTGLLVALVVPSRPGVAVVALTFVAAQLLLSYLVSGVAKAVSPEWRSGRAIVGILSTSGYGNERLHHVLARRPRLALLCCLGTVVFEAGFLVLVVVLAPTPLVLLGLGIAFHGSIAIIMGLNNFFWAFTSAYPPLIFVVSWLAVLQAPGPG